MKEAGGGVGAREHTDTSERAEERKQQKPRTDVESRRRGRKGSAAGGWREGTSALSR